MSRSDDVNEPTEDAIRRADMNASQAWKDAVYQVIRDLAEMLPEFTADRVWEVIAGTAGFPTQHEPSALGAVVRTAVKAGVIRMTGRYVESTRPDAHAKPIRVWESLLCQPVPA